MNMQDKDFDDLFRTKLSGLEVEPSARVWDNISAELNGPRKRRLSPVWSIAATTVILLSAAAWFLTDKPVKVQQNQVAVQKKQSVITDQHTESDTKTVASNVVEQMLRKAEDNSNDASKLAHVKHGTTIRQVNSKVTPIVEEVPKTVTVQEASPVIITETQPVLAAVASQSDHQAVVPDMNLSNQRLTSENISQPDVVKTPETVMARQPERKKKRGIHTLGGLINAVIAKVDKREDKLIEFTETDDDQADITGINLGLFKVKKEK